jgi:Na+/phosphate symporter
MILALLIFFQAADQVETTFTEPSYFVPVVLGSLVAGAILWLMAAVLGFARARAFGASTRWFSFAAVCLLLFHLQFLLLAFGLILKDVKTVFAILTFFNIFVVLAAICAIMGFVRLTNPR